MRSFIFCTSYMKLPDTDNRGYPVKVWIKEYFNRLRWRRWVSYYSKRKETFGAESLFIIDDGSPLKDIPSNAAIVDADMPLPDILPPGPVIFRFKKHLGRQSMTMMPGWKRSFAFSYKVLEKYSFDKIIHLESDAFVISQRMADYIKGLKSGWTTFHCPRHRFPEASIQVICRDSIFKLKEMYDSGPSFWNSTEYCEMVFPFSEVNKAFVGDRYGEFRADYPPNADFVSQSNYAMVFIDKLKPSSVSSFSWQLTASMAGCLRVIYKTMWGLNRRVFAGYLSAVRIKDSLFR